MLNNFELVLLDNLIYVLKVTNQQYYKDSILVIILRK